VHFVRGAVTVADIRRLPPPVTAIWDWQMRAACRDIDSSMFFHPENERGPAKAERDRRAKLICNMCPVIEACRRHALTVHEPYGVWGGLTVAEREVVLGGRNTLPEPGFIALEQ
jgi:WhiB family redox-sensing transcriptional regulator